ncbi:MAG: Crp/Fnr family transcriptional regulator [Chitinophagaceae bacterium]|nr:MAG: Crp/Fnr family transcriptional regulator [Chitinophagaceae bacterium]
MPELILSNFAMHITLAPHEEEHALSMLETKQVKNRGYLLRPGEINRHIYFVTKGCLRMFYVDADGAEHNISFSPENWWAVDIVSFFKQKPAINFIQALEDTELACFSLTKLEELFSMVPKFERFFRILTQNGTEIYQRRIVSNMSMSAEQRYLEFRKRYPGLEQRIAQRQIAIYLGITPAFLSMLRKRSKI